METMPLETEIVDADREIIEEETVKKIPQLFELIHKDTLISDKNDNTFKINAMLVVRDASVTIGGEREIVSVVDEVIVNF